VSCAITRPAASAPSRCGCGPGRAFRGTGTRPAKQLFVVSGSASVGGAELGAGDYLYTALGDEHDVCSRDGCELFITVPLPIELLEP
jgi:hypothetical protein